MAKVQVIFDIPDSVFNEYEKDGIEVRAALRGENYWCHYSRKVDICNVRSTAGSYLILRKKFQWPAGFESVAAMARGISGLIYICKDVPISSKHGWDCMAGYEAIPEWAFPQVYKDFPHPKDNRESIRINHNYLPPK